MRKKSKKQIKKIFRKEYILWFLVVMWSIMFWEGHRIFYWATSFRNLIPTWFIILNYLVLIISTTTFVNKKQFSKTGVILTLVCVLVSWIIFSVGYKHLPLSSFIVGGATIVVNLVLKIKNKGVSP
jgi:hypothetical protein